MLVSPLSSVAGSWYHRTASGLSCVPNSVCSEMCIRDSSAIEQHFINHNKEFASPIGIELTAEILVGVECYIVLKEGFQKIEECALACIAFLRYQ